MVKNNTSILNSFISNNNSLTSNLLNLIILLILICIIYQILLFLKKDNNEYYQSNDNSLVTDISEIGYPENGFTIQLLTGQYLSHTSAEKNVLFTGESVKREKIRNVDYDVSKFIFEPISGEEGKYYIKSFGEKSANLGRGDYIGAKYPGLSVSSGIVLHSQLKNSLDDGSKFTIEKVEGNKYLINDVEYLIKPYVLDTDIVQQNEYILKDSIIDHQQLTGENRCNSDHQITNVKNTTIKKCFEKCNNRSDCNYFQYYYKGNTNGPNAGTCVLYDDCINNMEPGGENSVIYEKTSLKKKMQKERENKYRILGTQNKNYQKLVKLVDNNRKKAKEIVNTIKEIDDLKYYSPGHSQKIVNEHKEILDLIEDPSRIKNFKHKIEQDIQDMRIDDLEKNMAKLEYLRFKNNKLSNKKTSNEIHGVKSYDNSQILNVYPGKDQKTNDKYKKNYMVFGNGGCLSYNQVVDNKGSTNQYAFTHCNVQNPQQQFKIHQINDKGTYNNNVYSDNDKVNSNSDFINYGFNILKPINVNNKANTNDKDKQCLSLNENGLTIEPCTLEPKQRFSIIDNVTTC